MKTERVRVDDPSTRDGRNVDNALGVLSGEGAQIEVRRPDDAYPTHEKPDARVPSRGYSASDPTYYDLPVLKQPTWIWTVPVYFYAGGAAGAASAFGLACTLFGGASMRDLALRCRWIAAAGDTVGATLLIADLGRPSRFLDMLRVFRPTSPMSVGSWILALSGATNAVSAVLSRAPGPLGQLSDAAEIAGGVLGLPLAGYTAVLLTNTAVPVWNGARRTLPWLFIAGGVAGFGAVMQLFELPDVEARAVDRFGNAGKVLELCAAFAVEREVSSSERAALPLHEGLSGALWKASKVCTVASLITGLVGGKKARRAAGILGTVGAIGTRLAVWQAGRASARDPRATFHTQRERMRAPGAERAEIHAPVPARGVL